MAPIHHHHCCCGLYWHRPNVPEVFVWYNLIPLQECTVEATVIDQMTQVDITQHYVNNESREIEASYIFPLDERAAVCGFEAEIDGKRVVGVAKEKQQARREYQAAVARGDGAYLMEEQKADIFKVKVGNIPPGEKVKIKITYVAELKSEVSDLEKRFLLPTVVAPRYTPPPNWRQSAADKSLEQPLQGSGKGYPLTLNLTAIMMSDITDITSPSHKISKTINGTSASVGFEFGEEAMTKDVIVNIAVAAPHEPRVCFEVNEGGSLAGMVSLFPHFQFADVPVEIVFVLDRSGSMSGTRIKQAQDALQLFMRSLPEDCYFNIVGFGSRHVTLFDASRKYDDGTLRTAAGAIKSMGANLGGTELVKPLSHVFHQRPIQGYPRQVFVLTDGQVSNTNEVIKLVEQHSGHSRVFSLGIGNAVSHHLVEGLARAGKGTAQFVTDAASMQAKVMKQLKQAIQPALRNVKVDWGGRNLGEAAPAAPAAPSGAIVKSLLGYVSPQASAPPAPKVDIHQAPFRVPPVFDGEHFLIYAIYGENKPPASVTITAESPEGPLTVELPVDPARNIQGKLVHTLAARAMIRDLEEDRSWMKAAGFARDSTQVRNEIVALGTKYQLVSTHTSFVAIEERSGCEYECHWGPYTFHARHPKAEERVVPSRSSQVRSKSGRGGGGGGANRRAETSVAAGPPARARARKKCKESHRPGPPPAPAARSSAPAPPPPAAGDGQQYTLADYNIQKESTIHLALRLGSPSEGAAPRMKADFLEEEEEECRAERMSGGSEDDSSDDLSDSAGGSAVPASHARKPVANLTDIAMEQSVNGSFPFSDTLAQLMGVSLADLRQRVASLGTLDAAVAEKVVMTLAVLAYLEVRLQSSRDSWELLSGKGRRFVEKHLPAGTTFAQLFSDYTAII